MIHDDCWERATELRSRKSRRPKRTSRRHWDSCPQWYDRCCCIVYGDNGVGRQCPSSHPWIPGAATSWVVVANFPFPPVDNSWILPEILVEAAPMWRWWRTSYWKHTLKR